MSRRFSLWFVAVAAVGVVVVGVGRPKDAPSVEVGEAIAPVASISAVAAVAREAAPLDERGRESGLDVLPPEDVEWVMDAVARTEAVRGLSEGEREALIAQLASVRRFAVLERTEPMAVEPEVGP